MAVKTKERMLPHSIEAEQSVLGCVLVDQSASLDVISALKDDDFYVEAHRIIFEAMSVVFNNNSPVDFVTLTDQLEKVNMLESVGGAEYIATLTNIVPSSSNYKHYCDIVKRNSVLRRLIDAGNAIISNSFEAETMQEALGYAEKCVFDISQKEDRSGLEPLKDSTGYVMDKFDKIQRDRDSLRGLPTGIFGLDKILNGLQKSDLIIVAARPGVGKTSLSMNMVNYAAIKKGASCAIFSLEMPKTQLAQRSLCSIARVSMEKALNGKLTVNEWKALWGANEKLNNAKIYVDDSSLNTPAQILSKCRRLKAEHGLDLIMIDYMQLMSGGGKTDNRQQEISEISRSLKVMARELNVPVIVLSQLNRSVEGRKGADKVPMLSDLRESGSIEQDADIVLFIHKPDIPADAPEELQKNPICEIHIAKHRNGGLGKVKVKWIGELTTFVNLERDSNEQSLDELAPPPIPNDAPTVDTNLPEIVPLDDSDITDIF
ncbi:MAG: replicative DNA helicase [Clostridia bacterium]|nr:replicative DNA helicase [Clostridia bacterium]